MKIALCQTSPLTGDIHGNIHFIREMCRNASAGGAGIAVFPADAITGYAPGSYDMYPGISSMADDAGRGLASSVGIPVIMGIAPSAGAAEGRAFARVIVNGTVSTIPSAGTMVTAGGVELFLADGTSPVPGDISPDIIVRLCTLPYLRKGIHSSRRTLAEDARKHSCPVLYMVQGGGQGEYIFPGGSSLVMPDGTVTASCPLFRPGMAIADTGSPSAAEPLPDDIELLRMALVAGIRDYTAKTGFSSVILGLSGGIDSALVAALACQAMGPENVRGITMPSPWSSGGSVDDSMQLARNLGIRCDRLPISPLYHAFRENLAPVLGAAPSGLADENIQARVRGTLLMTMSNATGAMVLATGNKSELAMGYCTMYGDMCGSLASIADLYKGDVYALARHINGGGGIIPRAIIDKAPSAELRENQKDEDSLPPYPVLDDILARYLDMKQTPQEIIQGGHDQRTVRDVINTVLANEYKRRQAAPILRVTDSSLGIDRNCHLLHRFRI